MFVVISKNRLLYLKSVHHSNIHASYSFIKYFNYSNIHSSYSFRFLCLKSVYHSNIINIGTLLKYFKIILRFDTYATLQYNTLHIEKWMKSWSASPYSELLLPFIFPSKAEIARENEGQTFTILMNVA